MAHKSYSFQFHRFSSETGERKDGERLRCPNGNCLTNVDEYIPLEYHTHTHSLDCFFHATSVIGLKSFLVFQKYSDKKMNPTQHTRRHAPTDAMI